MTKKELALEYHKKGYNCTQAVACAFCGEFGVSEEEMYKIADPWYTGNFDETYRDVLDGCEGFLAYLRKQGKL